MDRQERVRRLRERQRIAQLRREHPEWYQATGYHWLDPGRHDFWSEALRGCDYRPASRHYRLFEGKERKNA